MKAITRSIYALVIAAFTFSSCVTAQEGGDEKGRLVIVTFSTATRGNNDPSLTGIHSGDGMDSRIDKIRVLGYDTHTGMLAFNKTVSIDGALSDPANGQIKGTVEVMTGTYDVMFIANEDSDALLAGKLSSGSADTFSKLKELSFSRVAFTPTDPIPMATLIRDVKITGDNTLVTPDGIVAGGDWEVGIERLAVRIEARLLMSDKYAGNNPSKLTLSFENVPEEVYLIQRENIVNTMTYIPDVIPVTTDNGDGSRTMVWNRLILPESWFTPAANDNKAMRICMDADGNKKSALLGFQPDADYTMPRNHYFKINGTVQDDLEYSAEVQPWDKALQNTIIDRQYFLDVSGSTVTFNHFGGLGLETSSREHVFTVTTDYDEADHGFIPGIHVSHEAPDWLDISIEGEGTLEAKVRVRPNSRNIPIFGPVPLIGGYYPEVEPEVRKTQIAISAGNMTKTIAVSQDYELTPFFARSNIVLKDGRPYFAVTAADNAEIPANSQGILFKWSSLIGIRGEGLNANTWNPSYIIFTPEGSSFTTGTYHEIPYYKVNGDNRDLSVDSYMELFPPDGYVEEDALGDICRFISGKYVEGKWRTPRMDELMLLISETGQPRRFGTYTQITVPGSGTGNYGLTLIQSGTLMGSGITPQDDAGNLTNPGAGRIFFPAGGLRHPNAGQFYDANIYGYYWASTMGPGTGVDFQNAFCMEIDGPLFDNPGAVGVFQERWGAYSVRCIRD